MRKIPVVMIDDEMPYLEDYQELLSESVQFWGATNIREGIELIRKKHPEILLLDITLSTDDEGLEILPQLRAQFPEMAVIMVSNRDSLLTSRKATEYGAVDYFVKSENVKRLQELIALYALDPPRFSGDEKHPIAVSRVMRRILKQAKQFAGGNSEILITGETGVGKDVLAHFIHRHSARTTQPFQSVNCAAIEPNLILSELFGHKKGAFTGAINDRQGYFEVANHGVIFLDEIGELPLHHQAKLLHVIETKQITPVGSSHPIQLDVRIIAATNAPLNEKLQEKTFREDLFYRLNHYSIHIPPLREREEDIIPLAKYFLKQEINKQKMPQKVFGHSALLALKNYYWPGNVRELQGVVVNSTTIAPGREISGNHLKFNSHASETPPNYKIAQKQFSRRFLKEAITHHNGNISATARAIGISRQALQKQMKELNIDLTKNEKE